MGNVLEINDLEKSYRTGRKTPRREAINGLNLEVTEGQICGLLGPNGAGKTTTLKCILGLVNPDSGKISVFGSEGIRAEARKKIGFLPEQPYFELYLTPRKLLTYFGKLFGIEPSAVETRISHLLSLVGLSDEGDLSLDRFSKGMLQRMGIAQALINEPEFLILDEPSSGLDPLGKIQVREILEGLQRGGTTILISSHQLSEIEDVCDGVVIIDKGRNVASGSLLELLQSAEEYQIVLAKQLPDLSISLPPSALWDNEERLRLTVKEEDLDATLKRIIDGGGSITEVRRKHMSLEEFFMTRVKKPSDKDRK
jgi:ABC-2 type transport system ATP-binding protein